jgi:hypothetical protein
MKKKNMALTCLAIKIQICIYEEEKGYLSSNFNLKTSKDSA